MLLIARERPLSPLLALAAVLLSACDGCGGGSNTATGSTSGASSASGTSSGGDAGPMVDRGPTTVMLDGDANGLFWDAPTGTLYIADDQNDRILEWTDATGIGLVSDLPAAPANGPGLGQVIKDSSGKLIVTRFGYGTAGDVVYVSPDKTTGKVPNLDPTKRRIGLTVTADGTLYDSYFVKTATGQLGAVARLDLTGTETDVVTALQKPVGVLATGASLLISDQVTTQVLLVPTATPDKPAVLVSMIAGPDLLCAGPSGSFFMGGTTGDIRQIQPSGTYNTFAGGFLAIRGVAYDAANKRLFAAEHDPAGLKNAIHILPVN